MVTMLVRRLSFTLAAIAALALPLHGALGCTSFILQSQDGGTVYARTMEFALPLHSRVIISRGAAGMASWVWTESGCRSLSMA
jgi:penicillin V acylase-like amidase (Ntn superfamily)